KSRYFKSNSDLEIIQKYFAEGLASNMRSDELENDHIFNAVKYTLESVGGGFSVVSIVSKKDETKLIGFTDPQKIRPLILGKFSEYQMFASETPAIDVVAEFLGERPEYVRDVKGGEAVILDSDNKIESKRLIERPSRNCM